MSRHFYLFRVT